MQESDAKPDVLSTPGHLISLAARGFGVGHLPVLVALRDGLADTQRDLARFAHIQQPPMARDGLIRRTPDPDDGRSSRIELTELAEARLPEAVAALFQGNREALVGFTADEVAQLVGLLRIPLILISHSSRS